MWQILCVLQSKVPMFCFYSLFPIMQGICVYPQWGVIMTHSSFNSHVSVTEALEMFVSYNTTIEKEKCGASGANQLYDQQQAVVDKRATQNC